ncbi:MAG: CBS domain-containing protein [Bacteroides sp.]|nr:CBS domain-containing protein [Prevotella sp.]MCM1407984.1 CBS domain-containing protein [Treponema brennaborense]MCM1468960.1 CBS domain-containing protein [Bacteroides sp.]
MPTIPINTESSPEAVTELLFQLKIKDVMTKDIVAATPRNTMREIQQIMKANHITGVPVAENGVLAGIVSMDDIVNAFDKNWIDETCETHMTKNIIYLQENMPVSFVVSYFNKYKFGRFPVLNAENKLTGIITTSDVINALLVAMNNEVERLEQEAAAAQNSNQPETQDMIRSNGIRRNLIQKVKSLHNMPNRVVEFKIEPLNFETAGQASTEVKKILKSMGIEPALTRRIGIASYELEINQVVHSNGGFMRYYISPEKLTIEATDTGPGIPDIEKALTEGFSTATDRVRSLGFGAGMGLPNTKRVSDDFFITSQVGKGTTVKASFTLAQPQEQQPVTLAKPIQSGW